MKNLITLILALILVVSCVSLWACDGDDEEDGGTVTPQPTQETPADEPVTTEPTEPAGPITTAPTIGEPTIDEPTPTTPAEPTPPEPSGDIAKILDKATDIHCANYKQVMSGIGAPTATTTVWMKDDKIKTESDIQGMTSSTLIDMGEGKAYTVVMGMATEIDIPSGNNSPVDQAESVMQYSPSVVGSETIDGKECIIAEYTVEGHSTKMWIWEDNGFPLKIESKTAQGTLTIEHKDISFDCADDSVFEIPESSGSFEMPDIPGMP